MQSFKARMKNALRFNHLGIIPGNIYTIKSEGAYFWIEFLDAPSVYVAESEFVRLSECNARFWIWTTMGWVKLTIKPGDTLEIGGGGPCDEGSSYWSETYSHEGDEIHSVCESWGRDCDGRHEHTSESHCELTQLRAREPFHDEDRPADPDILAYGLPEWKRGKSGQRDYTAEAAGY